MLNIEERLILPDPTSEVATTSSTYASMSAYSEIPDIDHRHMWIITGPAGCGKSSVAAYLAHELSLPFIEGDDVSFVRRRICHTQVKASADASLVSLTG